MKLRTLSQRPASRLWVLQGLNYLFRFMFKIINCKLKSYICDGNKLFSQTVCTVVFNEIDDILLELCDALQTKNIISKSM